MGLQEIFDKVATHLLTQGEKSMLPHDHVVFLNPHLNIECAYRGENGLSCAVGCLIPDDKYDEYIEGKGVSEVNAVCNMNWNYRQVQLLWELQSVHDDTPIHLWQQQLKLVADEYSLNTCAIE